MVSGCLGLQRGGRGETRDALDQRQEVAVLGAELQEVALPVAEFLTPIDGLWSLMDGAAVGVRFAAAILPGEFDDVVGQPCHIVAASWDLALRRAMLPQRRTGATLGHLKLPSDMLDAQPATQGAQKFPRAAS